MATAVLGIRRAFFFYTLRPLIIARGLITSRAVVLVVLVVVLVLLGVVFVSLSRSCGLPLLLLPLKPPPRTTKTITRTTRTTPLLVISPPYDIRGS